MPSRLSRRSLLKSSTAAGLSAAALNSSCSSAGDLFDNLNSTNEESCLTDPNDFFTVARGKPKPHTLKGEDLVNAGMTPDSWKLEIGVDANLDPPVVKRKTTVEKQLLKSNGTALDYGTLVELGKKKGVKLIKAIQCLNIDSPLGQGLWEGVPLRDVLRLCGKMLDVRRVYFWGFHNNDPEQRFQSSLSYSQAFDSAPEDPPVFLAYKLNGKPISPIRGGPVRMIVPWAYGFKSIKWLQKIVLTNDPRANDTYANQNNDPDSPMKTAAYLEKRLPRKFNVGKPIRFKGLIVSGLSGFSKVQYLLRKVESTLPRLPDDHPEISGGNWKRAQISPAPKDWSTILPSDVRPSELIGFDKSTGLPKNWPLRYGMANWSVSLPKLEPGKFEFRIRTIDQNGNAQPDPRPLLKSGRNAVGVHAFEVLEESGE